MSVRPLLRRCAQIALASLALVAFSSRAIADPHAEANAADRRGDYAAELRILQPQAAQGRAWAQNNLGNLYLYGDGVASNKATAFAWFSKAADQGDAGGEMNVGQLYESGLGVRTDRARAAGLYRQSASHGRAEAWSMLKRLCDHGSALSARDCAGIPAGTRAAPGYDFRGKTGSLIAIAIKLLIGVVGICLGLKRLISARSENANGAAFSHMSAAARGGSMAAKATSSLIRGIVLGSVLTVILMVAPLIYVIWTHPDASPWSAPMVIWDVSLIAVHLAVVVMRVRSLSKIQ